MPAVWRGCALLLFSKKKKWLMTVLLMQIEQLLMQIVPPQQIACFKGRQMINDIWGVRSEWETANAMALLSIDYQNAFRTLSHVFIHSVLAFINLPEPVIQLITQSLKGDYYFCVGHTVIKTLVLRPQAGITQGDPLSPLIFSFCMSIICFAFRKVDCPLRIYLYVDDMLLSFSVPRMAAMLEATLDILKEVSLVSGPQIHPGKSAFVVKGELPPIARQVIREFAFEKRNSVKYIGVLIGHVTPAKAFAAPLAEAFRRAKLASHLDLTIKERLVLLKTWVLPVLLLTARAYVADHTTSSDLTNIHNILLSFGSWGVALHQQSQAKENGGYALPLAHT